MEDCLFCKISNKQINSFIIYEDDVCMAFLDINPKDNGHTLVVPKKHYKDFFDIDRDCLGHILDVAKDIGNLLKERLGCNGIQLVQNNGVYQDIKHFHLHLIPCYNKKELLDVKTVYESLKK